MDDSEKKINDNKLLELIKSVFESQANTILKNTQHIDECYLKAIEILSKANKIVFSGVGKSGNIALKAVATFNSLGLKSSFLHPTEALHGDLGILEENDVLVLLSKSGSTEELMKLFTALDGKTKVITITSNRNSFLAENSDVFLFAEVEKESCLLNLAPTNSTTLSLVICDSLAVALTKIRDKKTNDFAKNHPLGQLGRFTTLTVSQIMFKGNKLPIVESQTKIKDALIEMTNKALGCLCVEKNNELIGIVTDGDIRRTLTKYDDIRGLLVQEIMTNKPIAIKGNIKLMEALSIMENRESQINVLPVIDDFNKCIGVVRLHDIVKSGV